MFKNSDLVRGRDFQFCPNTNCGRALELKEACNFMRCTCGEGFCFVCGEGDLEDGSSHWQRGKSCPKFGQPGPKGLYDEHPLTEADEEN